VTAFILTPIFKEIEDWIEATFWMSEEMVMDFDVAPIADLFG